MALERPQRIRPHIVRTRDDGYTKLSRSIRSIPSDIPVAAAGSIRSRGYATWPGTPSPGRIGSGSLGRGGSGPSGPIRMNMSPRAIRNRHSPTRSSLSFSQSIRRAPVSHSRWASRSHARPAAPALPGQLVPAALRIALIGDDHPPATVGLLLHEGEHRPPPHDVRIGVPRAPRLRIGDHRHRIVEPRHADDTVGFGKFRLVIAHTRIVVALSATSQRISPDHPPGGQSGRYTAQVFGVSDTLTAASSGICSTQASKIHFARFSADGEIVSPSASFRCR